MSGSDIAVSVRDVEFAYGARSVLESVSCEVPLGEAVALLGPNGAGKTTLIHLLVGLGIPRRGTFEVFGATPQEAVAAGRVGVMPQAPALPPFARVGEVLRYLARAYPGPSGDRMDEAIQVAGVEQLVKRPTSALSGGERRRVQLAMAIMGRPDLLVLDEPTEGMDLEARTRFWDRMREHHRAMRPSVLFSTHDLSEADRFADRIILLSNGAVAAQDTPDRLKARLARHVVRWTMDDAADAASLAEKLGAPVSQTPASDRWEAFVEDSDAALQVLLETPGVRYMEAVRGSLDEVFRHLMAGGAPLGG